MRRIVFPSFEMKGLTLEEAVEFLRVKSRDLDLDLDLDPDRSDPSRAGVNIIISGSVDLSATITMDLKNVPMEEALRYVTELANTKYRVDPWGVTVLPIFASTARLETRLYPFPAELLSYAKAEFRNSPPLPSGRRDPFAPDEPIGSGIEARPVFSVKEWLAYQGIQFPPGSVATVAEVDETLMVRTIRENHVLIGELIDILYETQPGLKRPMIERSRLGR